MTYISMTETPYGRKEYTLDIVRFTADLAKALSKLLPDAKVAVVPFKEDYANRYQTIRVGADQLGISWNDWKRRLTVSIEAPDVRGDRNTYDKAQKTEEASVNPDGRTIERIAADIKRRVIDPSQEPLRLQREHAAKTAAARAEIVRKADALRAKCPTLDIRTHEREQRAAIYGNGGGHYLSGTLYADGTVALERIGSMPVEAFERIVAILNELKEKE
jgi:hypothetical protein